MSLPTVTQHLTVQEELGLIEKQGQLSSSIGRKAAAYTVRASARVGAGVEVLPEHAAVIDLYGAVIAKKERSLAFLNCSGLTVQPLAANLPHPVRFVHDAECAAELELWKCPELTDAVYLSLGEHLGGAIISNGSIQRGRAGRTGTFEHITLYEGGRQCYCGKQGCVKCYCSADVLLRKGESLAGFFQSLRAGDESCRERWTEYMSWLSIALNNIHMVMDSVIVLGGHIAPSIL